MPPRVCCSRKPAPSPWAYHSNLYHFRRCRLPHGLAGAPKDFAALNAPGVVAAGVGPGHLGMRPFYRLRQAVAAEVQLQRS
mmetsp:Transcript_81924/g.228336  ORF Transcript_81924/g.228336 Transcript_81924/m.228336 type:complete len:81 (-) Transcript_81924:989-1231(-)